MAYSTASRVKDPGAWCGGKRKRKGATSFTMKDQKAMLEDFQARMLWQLLLADRQLDRYEDRQDFAASIRSGMVKPVLVHAVPDGDGGTLSGVTEGMHERQEVSEVWAAVVWAHSWVNAWHRRVTRQICGEMQFVEVNWMWARTKNCGVYNCPSHPRLGPATTSNCDKFTESNIDLLRYSGFALHSILAKRPRRGCEDCELDLLKTLTVTEDEWDKIPPAI